MKNTRGTMKKQTNISYENTFGNDNPNDHMKGLRTKERLQKER